ncbi:MAG: AMP-binding protein [Alphaproteobacteria bacterium]|nr:AMP-binding protein [Alphaproteobacteria bacterium]
MALEPRKERTLKEVLKRRADKLGDKPWVVTAERAYSYREMDQRSNALARGFLKAGIKHGDTVLIMLPDTIDYILTWCALAKIGAIEVPVNNHAKGTVFAHVVNDSLARAMIVDRQYLDRIEFVLGDLKDLKRVVLYSKDATGKEPGLPTSLSGRLEAMRFETLFDADESALKEPGPTYRDVMGVMYTSGTTGPSKGSMNCHAHAYEYAVVAVELLEMKPDDIYYAPLPMFHIAGQWAVVYACMIAECTAVLTGTFSLTEFWNDVRKYKATVSFLLGAMANFLYRQAPLPNDADNTMDRIIVVPLLPEVEDFKTRFGVRVSTTYGGTEQNCPMRSTFNLANNRTCGRPLLDRYEVRLVDENDEEVPPNVPGEICVRTKNPWDMTLGYWNHPDWTVKAWRNFWYHTGDMLMHDEEGNYYFVDRTKDAIRRRGENISSMEVEQEIVKHPSVLECAVIPAESEHTEQEVMAVVVPRPGMTVDPVDLIRFLEPRMAYFMIPRYVDTIDALPKTPTGKIQKFPLRERGLTPTTWDREKAGIKLKR